MKQKCVRGSGNVFKDLELKYPEERLACARQSETYEEYIEKVKVLIRNGAVRG
jgi:hypothetical protein